MMSTEMPTPTPTEAMKSSEIATSISFSCIFMFILTPILIRYAMRYRQHQQELLLKKRYPKITLFICVCVVLILILERPSSAMEQCIKWDNNGIRDIIKHTSYKLHQILWRKRSGLPSFLAHGIAWSALTRYWLMYYNFSWTLMMFDSSWQVYIDPISKNSESKWLFKNKVKYGNIKWITKRIFIIYICIVFISLSCAIMGLEFLRPVDSILFFLPLLCSLIVWCKTPKIYDSLNISKEMKYISILFIIALILYPSVMFAYFIPNFIRSMFLVCLGAVVFWIFAMITTYWVLYSSLHTQYHNFLYENEVNLATHTVFMSSISTSDEQKDEHKVRKKKSVYDMFISKCNLDLFVHHLLNEFSLEIMVSLLEMIQYRSYIINHSQIINTGKPVLIVQISKYILNNKIIPQSFIVFGDLMKVINYYESNTNIDISEINDILNEYDGNKNNILIQHKLRAYFLWKKYIQQGAEMEVNIAFQDRQNLNNIFYNLNQQKMANKELVTIFDQVCIEMITLLKFSFNRFQSTSGFSEIVSDV
eukprot:98998_1